MSEGNEVTVRSLAKRVEELEQRVEVLEQWEPDAEEFDLDGLDQYDREALLQLRQVEEPFNIHQLREAYRSAGVRDKSKVKGRIQSLERAGVLSSSRVGRWHMDDPHE